ncbi:virion structural protein [Vibrio phage vB_VpaM_sm033]|nr:virion structural protein [Vibrio phage vB_VpaM_sm033]
MAIFPFDQRGVNPNNKILNEVQEVNSINGINLNYIVPVNAPFFATTLTVFDETSNKFLVEGTDYVLSHKFQEAEDNLALGVYGSFAFLDPNRTGRFIINYQTLGGDFVTSTTQAIANGFDTLNSLINIDWTDLVGVPPTFPPTFHTQPLTDLDAVADVIQIMQDIRDVLADPFNSLTLGDVTDLDTAFITPLLNALSNLNGTLAAKTLNMTLAHEQHYFPGNVQVNLGAMNVNDWTDTGLTVTVPVDGRYDIKNHINHAPLDDHDNTHQQRFLVDGGVVTESYLHSCFVSLPAGAVIKQQVRVTKSLAPHFYIAREGGGSSLTIMRVSN